MAVGRGRVLAPLPALPCHHAWAPEAQQSLATWDRAMTCSHSAVRWPAHSIPRLGGSKAASTWHLDGWLHSGTPPCSSAVAGGQAQAPSLQLSSGDEQGREKGSSGLRAMAVPGAEAAVEGEAGRDGSAGAGAAAEWEGAGDGEGARSPRSPGSPTVLSFQSVSDDAAGRPLAPRPERFTDYEGEFQGEHTPLIIDNGSFSCRMGWASDTDPRLCFRNIVSRPRIRATGQTVTVVGECDVSSGRGMEFSKSGMRPPFDSNVVYNFDLLESVLDYGFDRLGITGGKVDHPVILTEAPCNPTQCRARTAELMFEAYGVPGLGFGCDAVFSYNYNAQAQGFPRSGLLVCSGHSTTHVIPMVESQPLWEGTCRIPVGGGSSTEYLRALLAILYPQHSSLMSFERAEEMKVRSCYVAEDYRNELRAFQKQMDHPEVSFRKEADAQGAENPQAVLWQLPWTPPKVPVGPSEEEIARKAAAKERAGQRLRDMAAAKRAAKVAELEGQLQGLEAAKEELELLREAQQVEDTSDEAEILGTVGCGSKQQLDSEIRKAQAALNKAKGLPDDPALAEEDPTAHMTTAEKYPLLEIPDADLTPEQLKEKRRQRMIKIGEDARAKARAKAEEEKKRQRELQEEEERKYRENPEAYLAQLRETYEGMQEAARKRSAAASTASGGGAAGGAAGPVEKNPLGEKGVGSLGIDSGAAAGGGRAMGVARRGERVTAAHRERMKLLTAAAFVGGKGKRRRKAGEEEGDDDFGMRDEDWEVYKKMTVKGEGDEDEDDEESQEAKKAEAEMQRITARLTELDPEYMEQAAANAAAEEAEGPSAGGGGGSAAGAQVTEAQYQIRLGVERIRAAELVFQPSLLGLHNGGIADTLASALRRTGDSLRQTVGGSNFVFLCGGNTLLPGFRQRVESEFRMLRPLGASIRVAGALDPLLDSWRGARELCTGPFFERALFTKAEYDERGPDWFRTYQIKY